MKNHNNAYDRSNFDTMLSNHKAFIRVEMQTDKSYDKKLSRIMQFQHMTKVLVLTCKTRHNNKLQRNK